MISLHIILRGPGIDSRLYPRIISGSIEPGTGSTQPGGSYSWPILFNSKDIGLQLIEKKSTASSFPTTNTAYSLLPFFFKAKLIELPSEKRLINVHRCETSGSMRACHAAGPGSIPGRDRFPG